MTHRLDLPTVWIDQVRAGIFDAIPMEFTWEQSCAFAHLIDGYALCAKAGLGRLGSLANQRLDQARHTASWTGTALELWCCLFFEHRRYRHMGEGDPTGCDLDLLNRLCGTLRQRLQTLSGDDRQTLITAIHQG